MSGFFGDDLAGTAGTWSAALITLGVWAYLAGERRIFAYAQHALAGLLTGYVALISIREVIVPELAEPLLADPGERVHLWPAAVLLAVLLGGRYLPRRLLGVPVSLLVAGTAAFALGGAVAGTLAPQAAAAVLPAAGRPLALLEGLVSFAIVILVLLAFLHGQPRGRALEGAARAGRWLVIGGLGGWFGFILLGRLSLVLERLRFLLGDWLGFVR